MKKVGSYSLCFDGVYLQETAVVVGPLEGKGPLKATFDKIFEDNYNGKKNWELAEKELIKEALTILLKKSELTNKDINLYVGGDLNNQLAVTNYLLREYNTPYLGVYAACSTLTESLIIGSLFVDSGYGEYVVCSSSSHNATSERQFRYPTEYGGQKPDSLTTTATAAGVGLLSKKGLIKVTKATIGIVTDGNIKDAQDMGRAMAPAAALTLKYHLEDFGLMTEDYDLILTGDLSTYGSKVFNEITKNWHYQINNHQDCGLLLYDLDNQEVFAGGSGCGCVTAVTYGEIFRKLKQKEVKKVLIIATGALHNPVMIAQKESIPAIAHAIVLEREED